MIGYKLLNKNLTNKNNKKYEIGKKYELNGPLKYSKNGFHFSIFPEETLRFANKESSELIDDFTIVKVEASGIIECGDEYLENEQFDTVGVYASTCMVILKILSREEVFNIILNSNNVLRIRKYIQSVKLNDFEINSIRERYDDYFTNAYIDCYQYNDKDAFSRRFKK